MSHNLKTQSINIVTDYYFDFRGWVLFSFKSATS